MGGDDRASAIPQKLYDYSDQRVHAAQELQDWVRTVFTPMVHAYLSGAVAKADYAAIDVSRVVKFTQGFLGDLPAHIAAVYYTDRGVRLTGRAFVEADSGWQFTHKAFVTPVDPNRLINTTDAAVADAPRRIGIRAAAILMTDPAGAFRTLQANSDDPAVCAAFLKALSLAQRKFFLTIGFKGYANGIDLHDQRTTLSIPDPDAPELTGYQKLVLAVLGCGMQGMPTADTKKLMTEVQPYVAAVTPHRLRDILPALTQFLLSGVANSTDPPGDQPPEDWAPGFGGSVASEIDPYLAILKKADLAIDDHNALVVSMVQGAAINVLTGFVPVPPLRIASAAALNAVVGAMQSYVGSVDPTNSLGVGGLMRDYNGNQDVLTLNALISARAGYSAMISSLIANGKLVDKHGKVLKLQGGPEDGALITEVIDHSRDYHFKGRSGLTMTFLLYGFNDGAHNIDPTSRLAQILMTGG
ncbi:hypothetical protein [Streptomyces sp. NPDC001980]|uniref:hypothetical protein n=1 Tax=Streptomyces sp. NPDC001980 TaxID=3157126 RepID=UPI00332D9160